MNYEEMSNTDIRAYHFQMKEEYDSIKIQIHQLLDKLDKMDTDYLKGKTILNKRGQI